MTTKSYAERIAETNQMIADHKARLAAEHGLTDHPKLDRLYELAWSHGHASGFSEVEFYFSEFADLLK